MHFVHRHPAEERRAAGDAGECHRSPALQQRDLRQRRADPAHGLLRRPAHAARGLSRQDGRRVLAADQQGHGAYSGVVRSAQQRAVATQPWTGPEPHWRLDLHLAGGDWRREDHAGAISSRTKDGRRQGQCRGDGNYRAGQRRHRIAARHGLLRERRHALSSEPLRRHSRDGARWRRSCRTAR